MNRLLLLLMFLPLLIKGQNLVPNPGFENPAAALLGQGAILIATPWQSPSLAATPELFHTSYTGPPADPCDFVDVPFNVGGDAIGHNNSSGYAGISIDPAAGTYEYITVELGAALDPNEIYILDFYVQRADSSRYALNNFGALLSSAPIAQSGQSVLPFPPQFLYATTVTDANNWTHIQFIPYEAAGGERYLTIGIFGSPSFQDLGSKNSGCAHFDESAYYYIDDVTFVPDIPFYFPPPDTVYACPNSSIVIEATTNLAVTWSDDAGNFVAAGNTLTLPMQDTGLVFNSGDEHVYLVYGNNAIDSVRVIIIDPPLVDIGPDTTFCEGDSVLLNAYAPDAILYTWSTGDTTSFIYALDTGTYSVLVDNAGCSSEDIRVFHTLLPNPPVNIGEDSLFCFYNYDSLRLNATTPDGISYLWSPTGETSPSITVRYEDFYSVLVTKENGCRRQAGFEVLEVCPPTYFIPNAFTPDGDGINDIYYFPVTNYDSFNLRIYDRFGRLLFSSSDPYQGWDGKYNGSECPVGVYTYKINIDGFNADGEKERNKLLGTFVLYR